MRNFIRDLFFPPEQPTIAQQNGWDEENEKIMGLAAEIRSQYYPDMVCSGIMMIGNVNPLYVTDESLDVDYEVIKNFYK